jgi:hypothetical protein
MNKQELDRLARVHAGDVMHRRKVLKRLAGGAITSVLVLTGCTPGINPPTPIATSTPSPWVSPTPAAPTSNVRRDDMPTESSQESTRAAK